MRLVLRIFVEVQAQEDADALCKRISVALEGIGSLRSTSTTPYWKISEYFEILLTFEKLECSTPEQTAQTALGVGWVPVGDCALWNPGPESSFLVDEARWASVELIPATSYVGIDT